MWAWEGRAEIKATSEEIAAITVEASFKGVQGGFLVVDISLDHVWPAGKYELSIHEFGNCADLARAAGDVFYPNVTEKNNLGPAGNLVPEA